MKGTHPTLALPWSTWWGRTCLSNSSSNNWVKTAGGTPFQPLLLAMQHSHIPFPGDAEPGVR